ncbi:putative mitochondrial protein [Cucumis melo var. makuwa]|uniref:Putative mitochondrial protein n=1 Tax=Cucumis melo var. makuwa TaxID=1194695 RepID=A0A5D3BA30_CUCMM|nr:putative mitochondrial protein [Cucumis melo var. makuwa]
MAISRPSSHYLNKPTLSSSALAHVVGSVSSKALWLSLKKRYSFNTRSNILDLRSALYTMKKTPSESIDQYTSRIKALVDKLAAAFVSLEDEEILVHTLNGLQVAFNAFRTSIRTRSGNISLEELHTLLISKETTMAKTSAIEAIPTAMAAFHPPQHHGSRGRGRGFHSTGNLNFNSFPNSSNHGKHFASGSRGLGSNNNFGNEINATTINLLDPPPPRNTHAMQTRAKLDVKNAFLHGILQETVYMAQPTGFQDKTCPNHMTSLSLDLELALEFKISDFDPLKYFLGLEIQSSIDGIFVNQAKYLKDLLHTSGMTSAKSCITPMSTSLDLYTIAPPFNDPSLYRRLVGSLQYLTFTRPNTAFSVNRVNDTSDRRSTSGFIDFLGSNPISWSSKKQSTVSRSSTEAEYCSLATTTVDLY